MLNRLAASPAGRKKESSYVCEKSDILCFLEGLLRPDAILRIGQKRDERFDSAAIALISLT